MLEMLTKILYFVQNKSFNIIHVLIFGKISSIKSFFYLYLCPKGHTITPKLNFCPKCHIKCLVPNCLVPNCPGAKLSGCHIVCFYYLGAEVSALLSWCQIVLQSCDAGIFCLCWSSSSISSISSLSS